MKTKNVILIITIFLFALIFLTTISFAGDKIDTENYKTNLSYGDASFLCDKGANILNLLRNIAAIVSVVVISIIGLRYMVGSVEQRAEYKQTMMPVIIGCMLVGGLAGILTIIQSIF